MFKTFTEFEQNIPCISVFAKYMREHNIQYMLTQEEEENEKLLCVS